MSDKRLQSIIERAERVIDERLAVSADLKEIFAEAKSAGYDVRTIRAIIRERAMDDAERAEREALLETYRAALGMPGATYRSVAEQLGVSKSKLQRLVPSETRRDRGHTKSSGSVEGHAANRVSGVAEASQPSRDGTGAREAAATAMLEPPSVKDRAPTPAGVEPGPLDTQTAVSDQPGDDARTPVPSRSAQVVPNLIAQAMGAAHAADDLDIPPFLKRERAA